MPITVIDTITPKTPTFPVVADSNVQGGFQVCSTTAARDAIPLNNQKVGMLVYVTAGGGTYYQLTVSGSPGTWVVANLGGPVTQMIRIPIALVTVSSVNVIPIGASIDDARTDITTPYSPGTTISLGQAGSVSEFQQTGVSGGDNTPQQLGLYVTLQDTSAASSNPLLVTIAGVPAVGSGFAIVKYTVNPNV